MRHLRSRSKLFSLAASLGFALAALSHPLAAHADPDRAPGIVYTLSNAAAGNAVLAFARSENGALVPAGSTPTGGRGSGGGLGNQGALALSQGGHWLLAVNAGSNEVTVFARDRQGLEATHRVASGGAVPVSVTVHGDLVYVLNAGSDNLHGFNLDHRGRLTPIANSVRALSGAGTAAAQAQFSPDGEHLVVTEKATSRVLIYPVHGSGLLGAPVVQSSPSPTPFGFAFGKRDLFFVSEAAGGQPGRSSMSSYRLNDDGGASLVTASADAPGQTAACWVVVTKDGRFAYISNTGSGTLTGFNVRRDGALSLIDANGISGQIGAGSGPTDLAISRGGEFLFSLNPGNGTLSSFRIAANGRLTLLGHTAGIPGAATGLVAR